jgi:hypothetical protein
MVQNWRVAHGHANRAFSKTANDNAALVRDASIRRGWAELRSPFETGATKDDVGD